MFQLPKSVSLVAVLTAIGSIVFDAQVSGALASLLGEHASGKLAAVATIVAAFAKSLGEKSPAPTGGA